MIASTTAAVTLVTLGSICGFSVRRGWLTTNPVRKLEPAEKPNSTATQAACLEPQQLTQLLEHADDRHRPLFELLAYTGLRISEALGLTWGDIDHSAGVIRVHRQLGRSQRHAPLKTPASRRDVILAPTLNTRLREQRLASRYKRPSDLVYVNSRGNALDYRRAGQAFRDTLKSAEIQAPGRLTLHSLRHTYASLLIAAGLNVVFVSRQLGHANPTITLKVYAHLFQAAEHAQIASEALETSLATTQSVSHSRHDEYGADGAVLSL